MIFIYFISVFLAFLLGYFVPKHKIRHLRKTHQTIDLREIKNFLNYDGDTQQ